MHVSAVGGWDACGNRFYSKVELYQMAWADVKLDTLRSISHQSAVTALRPMPAACLLVPKHVPYFIVSGTHVAVCRVACARYGGPIATIRDDRKMVLVSGGITQPLVRIYSSAGSQMAVFIWDKGHIEAMGWTNSEDLIIVEQTGEVPSHITQSLIQHGMTCRCRAACLPIALFCHMPVCSCLPHATVIRAADGVICQAHSPSIALHALRHMARKSKGICMISLYITLVHPLGAFISFTA